MRLTIQFRTLIAIGFISVLSGCQTGKPTDLANETPAEKIAAKTIEETVPTSESASIQFDGRKYQIVSAEVMAGVADPYWCDTYNKGEGKTLSWIIRFETTSDRPDQPPPNIEFGPFHIVKLKNWHELVGYESSWDEPINDLTDAPFATIYVNYHEVVSKGKFRIASREGAKFRIIASGRSEGDEEFSIDSWAEFKQIRVLGSERDADDSIRSRLKQHIQIENLAGSPFKLEHEYQSGVKMGEAAFTPVVD